MSVMFKFYVTLFIQLFMTSNLLAQPAQIILIRHAEKPDDSDNINLSEIGFKRAERLAQIFDLQPNLAQFGPPVALFAPPYILNKNSKRSIQTLTPLSQKINIQINTSYKKNDYTLLAQNILSNPDYNNKTVMISWVHSKIVDLANALGSSPSEKWKGSVFDRMWVIKFDSSGKATSVDMGQRLLIGDSI